MFEPKNVAKRLKTRLPHLSFSVSSDWSEEADGEIRVDGTRVYVQVGENYLVVNRYDGGVFHSWPDQNGQTETLLTQLAEAIAADAKTLTPETLKEYEA